MLTNTIKFVTAAIAVYGAYKAVMDFLETDTGVQVKDFVSTKYADALDCLSEMGADLKEEVKDSGVKI